MMCRATRRERLLVSRGVHPHYRGTLRTYCEGGELQLDEIPLVADGPAAGTTDLAALERLLADGTPVAGVLVAQPNFLGLLEPMAEIGRLAHAAGAKFVAVVEPGLAGGAGAARRSTAPTSRPARASRWASRPSTAARTWASWPAPTSSFARSPAASSG